VPQDSRPVIALPTGASISGTVVDDRGRPVAKAQVHLFSEDPTATEQAVYTVTDAQGLDHSALRSMISDAEGRFRALGLPEGRYAVTANLRFAFPGKAVEVKTGTDDLRIALPVAGHLAGRVTGLQRWPEGRCQIRAGIPEDPDKEESSLDYNDRDGSYYELFETIDPKRRPEYLYIWFDIDAQGRFDIPVPLSLPFEVQVRCGTSAGPAQTVSPSAEGIVLKAPPAPV
jgi:hypothetical protein